MVELTRAPSRTPFHPRRSALRADPFWSGMWRTGSIGDWYSADDFRALRDAGLVKSPAWLSMSVEDAAERVLLPRNRETILRVLAALDQWRTMTVEQVEALTDTPKIAHGNASIISVMWNAGLIEICELGATFKQGDRHREGLLIRPTKPGALLREFEKTLSYAEWVSATAGLGFDADRQFARHNVLATDLGLRTAELANVGCVLGEKLSSMAMLAYSGVGADVPTSGVANGSDLTLVRPDGLRIAVEVTASISGGWFYEKVEKLVRVLHRRPLAQTGLCVLFVVAPRRDAASTEPREILRKVKRDVQKAVLSYPGTATDPTSARVAVTSWPDLFPSATEVADDFRYLPVERPTGPGYIGDPNAENVWERTQMLNPDAVPFTPDDPAAMTAVMENASGLRGVPHMLRGKVRPVLSDIVLERFGLPELVQVDGTKPVTEARGAAGAAGIPARLAY
ncbi:hypothetical protein [Microbacterium sp. 77mftsu3.1]|uniref:hypothetical protein n=1 Tax=Microbacterium sp. 77mftsu3.1 TaxID=1761802 RepID=UPI00036172BA|nr:hypothetical protein [Microbacterium sp. 77mftsu3.1]SDH40454.1 hypothetical protein SAMN04488590_3255 [Microbacterium sp. 77mftsu3.1]